MMLVELLSLPSGPPQYIFDRQDHHSSSSITDILLLRSTLQIPGKTEVLPVLPLVAALTMRNDVRKSANERPLIEMSKSTYGPPKGIADCCKHNLYPVNVTYLPSLA